MWRLGVGGWGRQAGILCQSKSVLVTCVFVHGASRVRSADTVKTVNLVPPEESLFTVSLLVSAVVTGLRDRRKYSVIIRQCLLCEKAAFQHVDLYFAWIYSRVNAGVESHSECSPAPFTPSSISTVQ